MAKSDNHLDDEQEFAALENEEEHQKKREAKKRQRMPISGKSVFELRKIKEKKLSDQLEEEKNNHH